MGILSFHRIFLISYAEENAKVIPLTNFNCLVGDIWSPPTTLALTFHFSLHISFLERIKSKKCKKRTLRKFRGQKVSWTLGPAAQMPDDEECDLGKQTFQANCDNVTKCDKMWQIATWESKHPSKVWQCDKLWQNVTNWQSATWERKHSKQSVTFNISLYCSIIFLDCFERLNLHLNVHLRNKNFYMYE